MEVSEQIEALLELAEAIGFDVRIAPLDGQGASACRLRGQDVLFVDSQGDRQSRLEALAGILSKRPEIEEQFIVPALREVLDRCGEGF